jgi:hypothetical protein
MRWGKWTWLRTSGLRGLERLVAVAIEVHDTAGRRVVGPYRPIGQPSGTRAQGVTRHGRPSARRTSQVLQRGSVINAAPSPAARAASSRFCTEG